MRKQRRAATLTVVLALVLGLGVSLWFGNAAHAGETTASSAETVEQAYLELFELSKAQSKSLVVYVNGQQIAGVVTRMLGSQAVELRNREMSRIVVRLDRIDAVGFY